MGYLSYVSAAELGPWKTPAALSLAAALLLPTWQTQMAAPETGSLPLKAPLIELAQANTVIMYAAPADADPVLRISTRDTDGNWQESELQLSQDHPAQSAKIVEAMVARETANQQAQP